MKWRLTRLFLVGIVSILSVYSWTPTYAALTPGDSASVVNKYNSSGATGGAFANDPLRDKVFKESYEKIVSCTYQRLSNDPDQTKELLEISATSQMLDLLQATVNGNVKGFNTSIQNCVGDKAISYLDAVFGTNVPSLTFLSGLLFLTFTPSDSSRIRNLILSQETKAQLQAQIALVNQLKTNATINRDLANGTITPEEASRRLANASQTAATGASQAFQSVRAERCNIFQISVIQCVDVFTAYLVKTVLLSFAGYFIWIFGSMLDYSITFGVLNFAALAPGGAGGIYPLWQTIRNIVDILLIFFGLGLAILFMINQDNTLKRFVPFLILYTIFVNFSWAATRTAVDWSNIITLKIYQQILPSALAGSATDGLATVSAGLLSGNQTPSGQLMQRLGLQNVVQKITTDSDSGTNNSSYLENLNSTPAALVVVVYAFFVAYVFLMASLIFIVRTFLLVFFIIGSPILLIDSALPKIGEWAKKARSLFFGQLTVGIVFMIGLFLVINIISVMNISTQNIAAFTTNGSGNLIVFFNILFAIALLYAMMKVVKSVSGDLGVSINAIAGKAISYASGGAGLVLRTTLGAAAYKASKSSTVDKMKDTTLGRGLAGSLNYLGSSTYDFAKVGAVQRLAKTQDVTLQPVMTKGYSQLVADRATEVSKTAEGIKDKGTRENYLRSQESRLGADTFADRRAKEYQESTAKDREILKVQYANNNEMKAKFKEIDDKVAKDKERRAEEDFEKETRRAERDQKRTQEKDAKEKETAANKAQDASAVEAYRKTFDVKEREQILKNNPRVEEELRKIEAEEKARLGAAEAEEKASVARREADLRDIEARKASQETSAQTPLQAPTADELDEIRKSLASARGNEPAKEDLVAAAKQAAQVKPTINIIQNINNQSSPDATSIKTGKLTTSMDLIKNMNSLEEVEAELKSASKHVWNTETGSDTQPTAEIVKIIDDIKQGKLGTLTDIRDPSLALHVRNLSGNKTAPDGAGAPVPQAEEGTEAA